MIATIKNIEQDKSHGLIFPCSEEEIKKMCSLLEIENNFNGKVILASTDNPFLTPLNGCECNLDEVNFFVKELYSMEENEKLEFFKLANEHQFDNMRDTINLLYNPHYFIQNGDEVYEGRTLLATYYKEPRIVVEIINNETLASDYLYLPCEDYVIDKAKARIDCFDENKISYEIDESFYSEKIVDIILQEKTLENYNYFSSKVLGLHLQESMIIDEMVDELGITELDDLKTLMGEFKKFAVNQDICTEIELAEFFVNELEIETSQPELLEFIDLYSYGEHLAKQEKGLFIYGNYVLYMGENSDMQYILDKQFQKELAISM